jgi:hypothetical protein
MTGSAKFGDEGSLLHTLKSLAEARKKFDESREKLDQINEVYETRKQSDPEFMVAKANAELYGSQCDEFYDLAIRIGLEIYIENPNVGKKLAGGNVTIKEITNAEITDKKAAREWATKESAKDDHLG